MQTFLPYESFQESARVLDRQRLGKQRVEGLQLLKGQWAAHPAAKMWKGHERALATYVLAVCDEWTGRGYRDTCADKIRQLVEAHPEWNGSMPGWLGDVEFHRAHRSNLLRKLPSWYGQLWPNERDDLPYIWPVLKEVQ